MDELEQKFRDITVEDTDEAQKDNKNIVSASDDKEKDTEVDRTNVASSSSKTSNDKKKLFSTTAKKEEKVGKITLEKVAELIRDGNCKNIIFMVGAGISTSVGIPDFRTKSSGLFDKLEKYKLPYREAIFDIDFFKKNPKPFFSLSRELLPGKFQPSVCHHFMNLMHTKGRLLRCYTQNIDGLERVAGMPADVLVEAHGTFHTSHCINRKCKREYSLEWIKKIVLKPEDEDNIPRCEKCNSVVKPDITFYGEMLPDRFYNLIDKDFRKCDLLIILGTSLTVQPFANLAEMIGPNVPRLMINLTKPYDIDWDSEKNIRNIFVKMETDPGSRKLANLIGWEKDLDKFINKDSSFDKIDQQDKEILKKSSDENLKKNSEIVEVKDKNLS